MKAFDLAAAKAGQPVQTAVGTPARILSYVAKTPGPLVGLIEYIPGSELVATWTTEGKFSPANLDGSPSAYDLCMALRRVRLYVAVADPQIMPTSSSGVWTSQAFHCKQDLQEYLNACAEHTRKNAQIIEIEVEF